VRVEESQLEDVTAPAKGIVVRRSWQKHVLTFLMVFGPGLIVMEADKIAMTRPVRISLGILRAYLIVMTLMLGYHVLDLAGVFHAIR
jgi:hypothetical protein